MNTDDVIINLSKDSNYYNQRNNEIDPMNTCATTSMVQALEISGYKFSRGLYVQPEDDLVNFIRTNKDVLAYYEKTFPDLYDEWKKNPKSKTVFQPNEVHMVLSYGTNLWMNKKVTEFEENLHVDEIPFNILVRKRPLVMSGTFGKLNHVLDCVGVIVKKSAYNSKKPENINFDDCSGFIFDDTYGYTFNYKDWTKTGNNVVFTRDDVINLLKPLKNAKTKYAHIIL